MKMKVVMIMNKCALLGIIGVACGLSGCLLGETRYEEEEAIYGRDHEDRGSVINELIVKLEAGKDLSQVGNEGTFYETVNELSLQGGEAEPYIIDALRTDPDWGIRLGCLHVLDGIGTKDALPAIVDAIDDPEPEVCLKATYTARGISGHKILETDAAPNIPPLPETMGEQGMVDLQEWHLRYSKSLRTYWQQWLEGQPDYEGDSPMTGLRRQ